MKTVFVALAFLIFCAGGSMAQKGTAEADYYPMGYAGDTWTGELTTVDKDTRHAPVE